MLGIAAECPLCGTGLEPAVLEEGGLWVGDLYRGGTAEQGSHSGGDWKGMLKSGELLV